MPDLRLSQDEMQALVDADHPSPRSALGFHEVRRKNGSRAWVVRVLEPDATRVRLMWQEPRRCRPRELRRLHDGGLFEAVFRPRAAPHPYLLRVTYPDGNEVTRYDTYFFSPRLTDFDLHLFGEGNHHRVYEKLGAHPTTEQGVAGTRFAVWAPLARRVSVVGPFNLWDGRKHAMQVMGSSGVWELFVPGVASGTPYKFEIKTGEGARLLKSDPYAFASQLRPDNCSVVAEIDGFEWHDHHWMQQRSSVDFRSRPMNVYEVHPASWRRNFGCDPGFKTWQQLSEELIPYVKDMGYTHLELMGLAEHPYDGSWGYQVTGYYAPTARHGSPIDFMSFVDKCHVAGIGVIMDWVPGHFPRDDHGLAEFDGTCLYEHIDPRQGDHMDWGTKVFNYGRKEVSNFLLANALYWLEHYHIDGLRVDAVASMLYLDYSRDPDDWLPNRFGGRENLEAIEFISHCNQTIAQQYPGVLLIAEESTAYPKVTTPVSEGGLGFNLKWNMGWMNDTLRYIETDSLFRKYDHHLLTFSFVYAWSEQFILPISHDEVVHGKRSLLEKMPGDDWQKRAGMRLYLSFMYAHPGKKLLFMGSEFGQRREWSEHWELDWGLLDQAEHRGLHLFCKHLNELVKTDPAMYELDYSPSGFRWISCEDHDQSVYAFLRYPANGGRPLAWIFNFTPQPRDGYALGVPAAGVYEQVLNSDGAGYGGSEYNRQSRIEGRQEALHGLPARVEVDIPPLAAMALRAV